MTGEIVLHRSNSQAMSTLNIQRTNLYPQKPYLYSMPSHFGEEFDSDFAPLPTSASDLPDLNIWILKFGISVLEIWASRRSPTQLSRWCHQSIYSELVRGVGTVNEVGKIRKIYRCEPLDGISEATLTVKFEKRVRALVLRFEGVDKRWLCTSLTLL